MKLRQAPRIAAAGLRSGLAGSRIEMLLPLLRDGLPVVRVGRCFALAGDIGPAFGILAVDFDPFLHSALGIGQNGLDRAFRLADAAIDTLVGMNDQHIGADIEAVDRAYLDAIHVFALDAGFSHHVGHSSLLRSPRRPWPGRHVRPSRSSTRLRAAPLSPSLTWISPAMRRIRLAS